jgi:bifunctional DNA-binding transcriptional regulator/antitoxin component of YhaV-PrlF toxin-antitoxin module
MKTFTKKIEKTEDYYVQFSQDELLSLGLKEGDKLSCEISEEGVFLKKYESIELDLSDFSREILEFLIIESFNKDLPVEDIIEDIIVKSIEHFDGKNNLV